MTDFHSQEMDLKWQDAICQPKAARFAGDRPTTQGHGQRASFCYRRHTHSKARKRSPGQAFQMKGPPADDETDADTTRSARSACLRCNARLGSVPTAELDGRAKPLDRAAGPTFEPPPESVSNLPHSSAALRVWACRPGG